MPYQPKDICNIGLGRLAASRVSELNPPRTPLERHCSDGYELWKNSELTKRRWVFALRTLPLVKEGPDLAGAVPAFNGGLVYRYPVPEDCLRPLRTGPSSADQWTQEGRYLLSSNPALVLKYVGRTKDADLSDEFVDVLGWRVAKECVEFATQSNTKRADIERLYQDAVTEARKNNAFVLGDERTTGDDEAYDWLTARW